MDSRATDPEEYSLRRPSRSGSRPPPRPWRLGATVAEDSHLSESGGFVAIAGRCSGLD